MGRERFVVDAYGDVYAVTVAAPADDLAHRINAALGIRPGDEVGIPAGNIHGESTCGAPVALRTLTGVRPLAATDIDAEAERAWAEVAAPTVHYVGDDLDWLEDAYPRDCAEQDALTATRRAA